jgi:hypothetical protein
LGHRNNDPRSEPVLKGERSNKSKAHAIVVIALDLSRCEGLEAFRPVKD